jgi:hypothetical protein
MMVKIRVRDNLITQRGMTLVSPQRSRLIRWDSGFQGEPSRKVKSAEPQGKVRQIEGKAARERVWLAKYIYESKP